MHISNGCKYPAWLVHRSGGGGRQEKLEIDRCSVTRSQRTLNSSIKVELYSEDNEESMKFLKEENDRIRSARVKDESGLHGRRHGGGSTQSIRIL